MLKILEKKAFKKNLSRRQSNRDLGQVDFTGSEMSRYNQHNMKPRLNNNKNIYFNIEGSKSPKPNPFNPNFEATGTTSTREDTKNTPIENKHIKIDENLVDKSVSFQDQL